MSKKTRSSLGGIFLVSGTAIGAGMLALPVSTSFGGFFPSLLIFFLCWGLLLTTAYFFLDVTLSFRGEPNLISMSGKTLGLTGKIACWIFYLLLLYALLAAYIAGCAPLFETAFSSCFHIALPKWFFFFVLPFLFGGFIYLGTQGVDYLNRFLMIGLAVSFFLVVGYCPSHVEASRFSHIDFSASLLAIPIIFTSFGYHIIIPTLATYMNHNAKKLRWILLIGSLIPLVIYLFWQWIIIGSVPFEELTKAWKNGVPATEPLSKVFAIKWIGVGAKFFSFFAIVTSFLGVSLSLSDFLTDGFKIKKTWEGRVFAVLLTLIPPLFFVFTCQKSFYTALEYAGAFVAILLGILPSLMVLKLKNHPFYKTFYGKALAFTVIFLCIGVILINYLTQHGTLNSLTAPYLK